MSSKRYIGVLFLLCAFVITLTGFHVSQTGDSIALKMGYFFSVVLLPILLSTLPASILVYLYPNSFGIKQKAGLFLTPIFLLIICMVYMYLLLQYGEVH
jgi:hypothetical protein